MAPFGFLQPARRAVPPQGAGFAQPTQQASGSGFTEVLKQPEVQAALIQFGINMLNPTYSGFGGQLGRSLGAAGAAAGRASGQRAERAERERARELEERKFGLAKRRVDIAEQGEKRRASGRGLSSLFNKPKSFQQFAVDLAKEQAAWDPDNRTVPEILQDPLFQQQAQAAFRTYTYGTTEGVEMEPEQSGLAPGHEEDGFRFLGGDPSDPNNWEPVE